MRNLLDAISALRFVTSVSHFRCLRLAARSMRTVPICGEPLSPSLMRKLRKNEAEIVSRKRTEWRRTRAFAFSRKGERKTITLYAPAAASNTAGNRKILSDRTTSTPPPLLQLEHVSSNTHPTQLHCAPSITHPPTHPPSLKPSASYKPLNLLERTSIRQYLTTEDRFLSIYFHSLPSRSLISSFNWIWLLTLILRPPFRPSALDG